MTSTTRQCLRLRAGTKQCSESRRSKTQQSEMLTARQSQLLSVHQKLAYATATQRLHVLDIRLLSHSPQKWCISSPNFLSRPSSRTHFGIITHWSGFTSAQCAKPMIQPPSFHAICIPPEKSGAESSENLTFYDFVFLNAVQNSFRSFIFPPALTNNPHQPTPPPQTPSQTNPPPYTPSQPPSKNSP